MKKTQTIGATMNNRSNISKTLRLSLSFSGRRDFMVKRLIASLALCLGLGFAANVLASEPKDLDSDGVAKPPAIDFSAPANEASNSGTSATAQASDAGVSDSNEETSDDSFFRTSKITEHRRENGQVYSIELEHSAGNKQYIEQNDADGLNDTKPNDNENEPPIAKWRLGSW